MAIRQKTVGTGITAREIDVHDGDDLKKGLMQFSDRWNAKQERGKGDYGAITVDMEDELNNVLAKAGPEPFKRDSKEDFARRILNLHDLVKKLIEAGDADRAARFACQAGYLYCEGAMKFTWEPMVEVAQRLETNRDNRNAKAKAESRTKNEKLYELFLERLSKARPKENKETIYEEMSELLKEEPGEIGNLTPGAIGKRIRDHKRSLGPATKK